MNIPFTKGFVKKAKSHDISILKQMREFFGYKSLTHLMWRIDWRGSNKENLIEMLRQDLIYANPILKTQAQKYINLSDDKKIIAILQLVTNRLTYTKDSIKWKTPDMWQDPLETWQSRTGDCEDGSRLIFCLGRLAGIPDEKLWFICGSVIGGGHAMVEYLDASLRSYIIDWCYYPDFTCIEERPTSNMKRYIKDIWFYVNDMEVFKR